MTILQRIIPSLQLDDIITIQHQSRIVRHDCFLRSTLLDLALGADGAKSMSNDCGGILRRVGVRLVKAVARLPHLEANT